MDHPNPTQGILTGMDEPPSSELYVTRLPKMIRTLGKPAVDGCDGTDGTTKKDGWNTNNIVGCWPSQDFAPLHRLSSNCSGKMARAFTAHNSPGLRAGSAKEFMMKQREFRGIWEWLKLDTTCGDFFGDAVPINLRPFPKDRSGLYMRWAATWAWTNRGVEYCYMLIHTQCGINLWSVTQFDGNCDSHKKKSIVQFVVFNC